MNYVTDDQFDEENRRNWKKKKTKYSIYVYLEPELMQSYHRCLQKKTVMSRIVLLLVLFWQHIEFVGD